MRKILALITVIAIASGMMPAGAALYSLDNGAVTSLPLAALESPMQSVSRLVDVENPLASRYAELPARSNPQEIAVLPAPFGPKLTQPRSGEAVAGGFSAGLSLCGAGALRGQTVYGDSPGGDGILSAIMLAFLVILSRISLPRTVRCAERFSARLAFESRVFLLREAANV